MIQLKVAIQIFQRSIFTAGIIFIIALPCLAMDLSFSRAGSGFESPPAPTLLYPVSEEVILTGKETLEFRWLNDYFQTSGFIFKIYKGRNMYSENLIYKKDLNSSQSSINIKANLFEDGQVYTWSLVRVSLSGAKSDKSFNSFKAIKNSK